ncbi:hypothetical protein K6Q96_23280 [Grimontia kaedaensis]|uniref:Anti-sigma factor n=1 Tax=Grimontia kaedaensis TaxID=2872157 RepID=A0ABY4X0A7_9GAMM|nr:hypothetical protein [Grimontia kaedaensis]USH04645.1 hypothetical protein K6Q96_23280 [Grimontia kaedaensis]
MTAPIKDEDIVALYKESATETSGKDLDDSILAYANSQHKKRIPWWTYAGLVATVSFVAFLAPWQWVDQTLEAPQDIEFMSTPETMSEEALSDSAIDAVPSIEILPPKPEEQRLFRTAPSAAKSLPQMEMEIEDSIITEFPEVERLLDEGQEQQARELLEQMLTDNPKLFNRLPERLKTLVEKEEN